MKPQNLHQTLLILAAFALLGSTPVAVAQTFVSFANTPGARVTTNSVPCNGASGYTSTTAGAYIYGLFIAPANTTDPSQFTFTGLYATNTSSAGRFSGGSSVLVSSWSIGGTCNYLIRGWSTNLGSTWGAVLINGQGGTNWNNLSSCTCYYGESAIGSGTSTGSALYLFGTAPAISSGFALNVINPPAINYSGSPSAFTTTYGTASTAQTFLIVGTDLSASATVTTPAGFEVSVDDGSSYATNATLNLLGNQSSAPILIRLAATAPVTGDYNSQNIILSSGLLTNNLTTSASGNSVAQAVATITGLTGVGKVYDGTTNASFTGTPAYAGLVNGESFSVSGTPAAAFGSAAAGSETIYVTGYNAPSPNYSLAAPALAASITPAPLAITGLTGGNKVYDGDTRINVIGTPAYVGLVNGESFEVVGTAEAVFTIDAAGYNRPIRVTGFEAPTDNYSLKMPIYLAGNITPAPLTITGLTGVNKVYDGLTYASVAGTPAYSGLRGDDSFPVSGKPTATFVTPGVGDGVTIDVTGYFVPSGNYTLTQPKLQANITQAGLTITGIRADSKIYDGTVSAMLFGTPAYVGLVNGETFSVVGTPSAGFITPAVGIDITVHVSGFEAPTGNYSLTEPTLAGDINRAPLTVIANDTNRVYGAANPAFTASYKGFVHGETSAVLIGAPSLTTTATVNSLPGSYPIIAAAGSLGAENYAFNFANGTLSVIVVFGNNVTNLLEGPASGADSVALEFAGAWTATNNVSWLRVSAGSQSGINSATVAFTYDANSGPTRTGTLTIAGISLPVTQAGVTYVATPAVTNTYVDPTARLEGGAAGSDALPPVLPTTANLTGAYAPTSDSPDWLTITGVTNGVVNITFTANTSGSSRTGNVTLLGVPIPVTQGVPITLPQLTALTFGANGSFQFGFSNNQGASFSVWSSTNLLLPFTNWTLLGPSTNNGSGQYQFSDPAATNGGQRFYRVSSP